LFEFLQETLHKHSKDTILDDSVETIEESLAGTDVQENGGGCLQLFTNWPLMSAITVYCIFSLQDVAYAEVKIAACLLPGLSAVVSHEFSYWRVFPPCILSSIVFVIRIRKYMQVFSLWAVSDRAYGGLSFSSTDVGNVLSISGIL
jgi:hypothetical protein